jgi:hypothetical protein
LNPTNTFHDDFDPNQSSITHCTHCGRPINTAQQFYTVADTWLICNPYANSQTLATLSLTFTEKILLPTAMAILRRENTSISSQVCITTSWLCALKQLLL